MVTYAQVKRHPGKPTEVKVSVTAPEGWDDSEERELEWLARGASELARSSHQDIDKELAKSCRKKMLEEMRRAEK